MAIDLKSINENLAKAKAEADFWEMARQVLSDPRIAGVDRAVASPPPLASHTPSSTPRLYGDLMQRVFESLPDLDGLPSMTTSSIVDHLMTSGYEFQAKEPSIAVNGALVSLQEKGLAKTVGRRGNAKLWRKGKQENQEPAQDASQAA
jgi:hypothetical protein